MAVAAASDAGGFQVGDRVRSRSGTLSGYVGVIVEIRHDLLVVSFEIFDRATPVQLRPDEVVPAE